MISWFKKKHEELEPPKPDIEFVDVTRKAYTYHPVQLAKDVQTHFQEEQIKKFGTYRFVHCPGMFDYKNYGYIIPAWDDIHIMANKAGTMALIGTQDDKRKSPFPTPSKMATDIGHGVFQPQGIPYEVLHIGSPWKIISNTPGISVLAMPAFFHSSFLDDLYVYPGIVDYGNFTEINFIASAKRACSFTIKAGEPLLHIIPFKTGEISAGYGPATEFQKDQAASVVANRKQFYRKLVQVAKQVTLKPTE